MGISAAIIGAAAIGAGAGIGGAALQSRAAGKAANAQESAANYAANLQHQDAQAALDFQKQQWNTTQQQQRPWLQAGTGAINSLAALMAPGGQLSSVPQFQAPTDVTEQNDPGYQFRVAQGMKAIQASAAARGNLLSTGTVKALNQFGQDYASNEYGNVYNRALTGYNTQLNAQNTLYNRYAGLSGVGQQAATNLGQLGQQTANNVGNILMTSGQQQGNAIQNAAAARASGYVGGANAWGNALSGIGSNLTNMLLLQQLFGGGGGSAPSMGSLPISANSYPYFPMTPTYNG